MGSKLQTGLRQDCTVAGLHRGWLGLHCGCNLAAPGATTDIDRVAGWVIFGGLGCPKILDLRSKIKENRTEGTEGL